MKYFAAFLVLLGCTSAIAGPDVLYGSWEGGDTAARAIYGVLHISEVSIAWGRKAKSPGCTTGYTLIAEPAGVTFKNQTGRVFTIGSGTTIQTYLLKIRESKCTGTLGYLRLTIESDVSSEYSAMVEYSPGLKEEGWMHFHKR